jgi:hypothetical protein
MAEGIQVEVTDGFAHIQFLDREKAGPAITKLLELGGPGLLDVDTRSNSRKTYIVPESIARDAGLLDEAAPTEAPADDQPDDQPEDQPADAPEDQPEGEPSDSWTVAQLTDYAKREEIDLGGATRKADILSAIQAASQPASQAPVSDQA